MWSSKGKRRIQGDAKIFTSSSWKDGVTSDWSGEDWVREDFGGGQDFILGYAEPEMAEFYSGGEFE
jgi:hypothetical protein